MALAVAASLAANGCADPACSSSGDPLQEWIDLAGHQVNRYIPTILQCSTQYTTSPVLFGLHGQSEEPLASFDRWKSVADTHGLHLMTGWESQAQTQESMAEQLSSIAATYIETYHLTPDELVASGWVSGTPVVWYVAFEQDPSWSGAVFLGGVPPGDWITDPDTAAASMLTEGLPRFYYVIGQADSEYDGVIAFRQAMTNAGVGSALSAPAGTISSAEIDFAAMWGYLLEPS